MTYETSLVVNSNDMSHNNVHNLLAIKLLFAFGGRNGGGKPKKEKDRRGESRDWRKAQKNIEFDFYASKAITKDRQLDGFEDRGKQGLREMERRKERKIVKR